MYNMDEIVERLGLTGEREAAIHVTLHTEPDDDFSTLCGNRNERSILESTLGLFSTLPVNQPLTD